MNFISNVSVKYTNNFIYTKKKQIIRRPPRSKDVIENEKYLKKLKQDLKNKKKKTDFDIFEKLLTCVNTKLNDDKLIINYFKTDSKDLKLSSKYKCSQKNCLFCKRSKLLKNIYKKNVMFYNSNDVQTEKLFITISLENISISDLSNIDNFTKLVKKEKQKIKDYFNQRKLTFFGAVEIANKLHFHLIVNDFNSYSFDIISSEIRSLFGYTDITKFTTNIENLKRIKSKLEKQLIQDLTTDRKQEIEKKLKGIEKSIKYISDKDLTNTKETKEIIENKTYDYISKIFEYVSKTYDIDKDKKDKLQQNYIDIDTTTFKAFSNIKNITDSEIEFYKNSVNKYNIETIQQTIDSLNKIKESDLMKFATEKNGIYYFFVVLLRHYNFFAGQIISEKRNKLKKHYIEKHQLQENFFNVKHSNIFDIDIKNKFENEFKNIKNETMVDIWKNYFISKIKNYKKLSETLSKIIIDSIEIDNKKTRVYSNFFVTSPFKKIFFSNISVLQHNKKMSITKENGKNLKIENVKYDRVKEIKDNIKKTKDVFNIENEILLTARFSNVELKKLANQFYKNSIEKINKTLKRSDFDKKEIIEFLEISIKNRVIRSLNKFKKNASAFDYENRVNELYKQKLENVKKFIILNYK